MILSSASEKRGWREGGVSKKSGALLPARDFCRALLALSELHGFSLILTYFGSREKPRGRRTHGAEGWRESQELWQWDVWPHFHQKPGGGKKIPHWSTASYTAEFGPVFIWKTESLCLAVLPACWYLTENSVGCTVLLLALCTALPTLCIRDFLGNTKPYQGHELSDEESFDMTPTDSRKLWIAWLRFIPTDVGHAKISCLHLN